MGQTGRRRVPTELRLLRGESRPSRIGHGEPVPRAGEPGPPEWLTAAQRAIWDRLTAELRSMNLLHSADADVLIAMVLASDRMQQAATVLAAEGLMATGRDGGQVRHPASFIAQSSADQVRRLGHELGLTPAGRADLGRSAPLSPPGLGPERLLT